MSSQNTNKETVSLLRELISNPSFSGEEDQTAAIIQAFLEGKNIETKRSKNNVWAFNKHFDVNKPSILLNSHHDTVRPNTGYTRDPFDSQIMNDKLFGLGSNDAGGSLVALLAAFEHFYSAAHINHNLIYAATAEEESSGKNGLNSILPKLPKLDFAIVGEPTKMNLAIAEKGLLVIDAYAQGTAGHAAHPNSNHSIYKAIKDIEWIKNYEFEKVSKSLGKVKATITQINAGTEHNVIPNQCHFVIDVRVTDEYRNQEVFDVLNHHTESNLKARSFNLNSSSIDHNHPIVRAGVELGRSTYGSPTLSDQSVLSCPSLKLGPGDSMRSHQSDEFIKLSEIDEAVDLYIKMLEEIL